MLEINKVMFEIYRERLTDEFRVVYFTELNDHTRDKEIDRALAGDHFYDGFIKEFKKQDAKILIDEILGRMNAGEELSKDDVESILADHIPELE